LGLERILPELTSEEFRLFQQHVRREAGIHLSDAKRPLVVGRLARRLRELGLRSFRAYFRVVTEDPAEAVRLLDLLSTNQTSFFREPLQFDFLERRLLPDIRQQAQQGEREKRLRVWSAACSTGEEPFSLAMILLEAFPAGSGWDLDILATDVLTRVLDLGREAVWPIEKAAEIPDRLLRRYMLKGRREQEGRVKAGPELRALVRFSRLNLNADTPLPGPFDLIFCRNVLIYFGPEEKRRVLRRLFERLAPGGCLFLGHAESLSGIVEPVRCVGPMIYTHHTDRSRGGAILRANDPL
jgi:chemotaxis protein methyltransferase CheR